MSFPGMVIKLEQWVGASGTPSVKWTVDMGERGAQGYAHTSRAALRDAQVIAHQLLDAADGEEPTVRGVCRCHAVSLKTCPRYQPVEGSER